MRNRLRRTPGPRQQVGTALREHARRAVRSGGPPTIAFAAVGADDVTQRYARTVVDLTLRLGDALLSTGASASDVVTTMLDDTIPLTTFEYDEWGNPNDQTYYEYMLSYSPYDQVEKKAYPNLLITTGLHDSQVQYWEPAKWLAKLRAMKTDSNRLLMYTNMDAGHGGASARYKRYEEVALQYAFLLDLAGAKK